YRALVSDHHGPAYSGAFAGEYIVDAGAYHGPQTLHHARQITLLAMGDLLEPAGHRAVGADAGVVGVELTVKTPGQDRPGNGRKTQIGPDAVAGRQRGTAGQHKPGAPNVYRPGIVNRGNSR